MLPISARGGSMDLALCRLLEALRSSFGGYVERESLMGVDSKEVGRSRDSV